MKKIHITKLIKSSIDEAVRRYLEGDEDEALRLRNRAEELDRARQRDQKDRNLGVAA